MLTTLATMPLLAADGSSSLLDKLHDVWFRHRPAPGVAANVDWLFMWIFWFCVAWFVFLMALMVYWTVKYRRRPGAKLQLSSSHNTPLEILWTVGPLIPLAYIFFKGFHGYVDTLIAPGDSMELLVTGSKWKWEVSYPNGGATTESTIARDAKEVTWTDAKTGQKMKVARFGAANESLASKEVDIIYVPAERNIRCRMNSKDVMHAFWIPDFRVKQDVLPNRYTSLWFRTPPMSLDAPKLPNGEQYEDHWVFCAEYCGEQHSEMMVLLRVVSPAYFEKWVARAATSDDPVTHGFQLYKRNCNSCHSVDGSANTGPSWFPDPSKHTGFGSQIELESGATVQFDENYAKESILTPQAKVHKGFGPNSAMNSFAGQLSDQDIEHIIAYMKQLGQQKK